MVFVGFRCSRSPDAWVAKTVVKYLEKAAIGDKIVDSSRSLLN